MAHIDDIKIGECQAVATQIRGAYIPWYKELAHIYSDTKMGTGKLIREQQDRIAVIMGLLGRAMGAGGTTITEREYKKLTKEVNKLKEVHSHITKWMEESAPHTKDTEMALDEIGLTPKDLGAMTTVLEKKKKAMGSLSQLTRSFGLPGMRGMGLLGVLSQAKTLAGPLAGPLTALAGAGYGGYRLGKAWKQRKARKQSSSLGLSGMGMGTRGKSGPAGMPGLAGTGVVEGMASTYPRDARGRFTARGGLTGIDNIEKGLFKFFNKRAMKARWTRNMLRAAQKKSTGGMGVIGGIAGSFTKLKFLLPGLLLALGKGAGLAGAVAFTAYELHKLGKVAIEWWEVHKNVTKSIKKQHELSMGFLDELSVTLADKMRGSKDEAGQKEAAGALLDVEKEKVEKREQAERKERGFFGNIAHDWKAGVASISGDVGRFEEGGLITKPTIGVLGEKYKPEVVTPLSSGNVMDVLKAIKKNTASATQLMTTGPVDTFKPPFDLGDPLLNRLNTTGSLNLA